MDSIIKKHVKRHVKTNKTFRVDTIKDLIRVLNELIENKEDWDLIDSKIITKAVSEQWSDNPNTEFECNKCGYTWKLGESIGCPKCDGIDGGIGNIKELPIYKIQGKFYFFDKKLNEYRNIRDINDILNADNIKPEDLEKPTKEDKLLIDNYRHKSIY